MDTVLKYRFNFDFFNFVIVNKEVKMRFCGLSKEFKFSTAVSTAFRSFKFEITSQCLKYFKQF